MARTASSCAGGSCAMTVKGSTPAGIWIVLPGKLDKPDFSIVDDDNNRLTENYVQLGDFFFIIGVQFINRLIGQLGIGLYIFGIVARGKRRFIEENIITRYLRLFAFGHEQRELIEFAARTACGTAFSIPPACMPMLTILDM